MKSTTAGVAPTALESAGVIFILGDGDGPGVRLRKDGDS